jgi:hypothetical protein
VFGAYVTRVYSRGESEKGLFNLHGCANNSLALAILVKGTVQLVRKRVQTRALALFRFSLLSLLLLLLLKLLQALQPFVHFLVCHRWRHRRASLFIILETTYICTVKLIRPRGATTVLLSPVCSPLTKFILSTSSALWVPVTLLPSKAEVASSMLLLKVAERLSHGCLSL